MKKSKNTFFIVSFFLVMPFLVGAVSEDVQTRRDEMKDVREVKKTEIEDARAEKKEIREEKVQARCENIEGRIKERVAKYESGQTSRLNVYKSIQSRLNNLVAKVERKGYDTGDLKTNLERLDQKKTTFMNEFEKHMTELRDTQNHVCGDSEGAFKNQLRNSRNQLKAAREAHTEFRNFFKNEIKADVAALKSQVEADLKGVENKTE